MPAGVACQTQSAVSVKSSVRLNGQGRYGGRRGFSRARSTTRLILLVALDRHCPQVCEPDGSASWGLRVAWHSRRAMHLTFPGAVASSQAGLNAQLAGATSADPWFGVVSEGVSLNLSAASGGNTQKAVSSMKTSGRVFRTMTRSLANDQCSI